MINVQPKIMMTRFNWKSDIDNNNKYIYIRYRVIPNLATNVTISKVIEDVELQFSRTKHDVHTYFDWLLVRNRNSFIKCFL